MPDIEKLIETEQNKISTPPSSASSTEEKPISTHLELEPQLLVTSKVTHNESASDGHVQSHDTALEPSLEQGDKTVQSNPESEEALPSQKLIYELAIKKVETLDRYFDGLNVRAGAILGFAGFILPNALSASKEVGNGYCMVFSQKVYWPANWLSKFFAISEFGLFLAIAIVGYTAYQIESDRMLPPLDKFYTNEVRNPEWQTRERLISHIHDMCNRKSAIIEKKSSRIKCALILLVLEITLISIAFCIARICA